MTMTFKLPAKMEQQLRRRGAALGKPVSAVIREALAQHLAAGAPENGSAYALGADLFGRYGGKANVAESRKTLAADIWAKKHAARSA